MAKRGSRPVRELTDVEARDEYGHGVPVTIESAAAKARNAPNLPGFPVFGPALAKLEASASPEERLHAVVLDSLAVVEHHALETLKKKEEPGLAANHRDAGERCRFYEKLKAAGGKGEPPPGTDPDRYAQAMAGRRVPVKLRRAQAALGVLDATDDARAAIEAGDLLLALARVSGMLAHAHVADVVTGYWRHAEIPHARRSADEALRIKRDIRRQAAELEQSGMKKRAIDARLAKEHGVSEKTARAYRTARPPHR